MDTNSNFRTVMFVVWDGFGARLLLRTGIFQTLKEAGVRLVILCPNPEEEYFTEEFRGDNVHFENLEVERSWDYFERSPLQRAMRSARQYTLSSKGDLRTVDARFQGYLSDPTRSFLTKMITRAGVGALRHFQLLRTSLIGLETRLYQGAFHPDIFHKYRPDLVITTTLGTNPVDLYLMREAKKFGSKTYVVIQNWDHPSKGLGGVRPDWVVVWGPVMQEDIHTGHGIREDRIFEGGPAQFDVYAQSEKQGSREEVLSRFNLDPERKVIFFATKAPQTFPYNADIVEILAKAMDEGRFCAPVQILVRLHPRHFAGQKSVKLGDELLQTLMARYEQLGQKFPQVVYDSPVIVSQKLDGDAPKEEMHRLASLLKHTDVLVTPFGTLNLEAFQCNVPSVNIAFKGYEREKLGYEGPGNLDADMASGWIGRMLAKQCTRIARSKEELVDLVNDYLLDPGLDSAGRAAVVKDECGISDGSAGVRIGRHILSVLNDNR